MRPADIVFDNTIPAPDTLSLESIRNIISTCLEKGFAKDKAWDTITLLPHNLDLRLLQDIFDEQAEKFTNTNTLSEEIQLYEDFKKNKTTSTYSLAEYITKKYNIITVGEKEREMFVYQDGYYRPAENLIIFPEIQRILKDQVTKNAKNETLHKIADQTSHPREVFTSAHPRYIPLLNGVYDRETALLLPHSPEYRFTYQFPILHAPNATCPRIASFLDQILTPDQRQTIEEWLGYYFYRQYIFKKAIILVGDGDTGKTTFLETVMFLLGKKNVSAVSLQKMAGDKFAAAQLYEKHGNLVDELSAKDITDTGNFKIATGGGSINAEYKYGNQFSFINYSKLTFACNKIPDVKDMDDLAYFNRWLVITFSKTIEKKIPNFIATLTLEEERSGLFNLAMKGLTRLLAQGEFSNKQSGMDTKREMMRSGSSIAVFIADRLVQEVGAEITKVAMYEAYVDFCTEQKTQTETMDMFGKKFLFYTPYASEGLVSESVKRVRGWRNVALVKTDKIKNEEALADEAFNKF